MSFAGFSMFTVIREYMKPYEAKNANTGEYDDAGLFIPGTSEWQEYEGAVTPLTAEQLQADTTGVYTHQDRNLFTFTGHEIGTLIRYRGIDYKVHSKQDKNEFVQNADLTSGDEGELYAYILKAEGRQSRGRSSVS
jgi:hypothetical protein